MKSYTDIEQSRKLAEILPIESADLGWYYYHVPNTARNHVWLGTKPENADIPCWSLAALVLYLSSCKLISPNSGEKIYYCKCEGQETSADNSVDACYKMIIKLNEQKLL